MIVLTQMTGSLAVLIDIDRIVYAERMKTAGTAQFTRVYLCFQGIERSIDVKEHPEDIQRLVREERQLEMSDEDDNLW